MKILVVGPHPDDQELGMGATIALLAQQGHDVLLLDVTDGEPTPYGSHEIRRAEARAALDVINEAAARSGTGHGVSRLLLGLENRTVEHTIAARHAVAGVIRAHQAEMIFVPYPEDAHPDHRAVTRIAEDARFDAKLSRVEMPTPVDGWTGAALEVGPPKYAKWFFYYYATHLRWVADPSFVVDVSGLGPAKIASIKAYHTQFVMPEKNRGVVEWVEASLRYFGSRIGVESGEAFFTKEPLGLTGLATLAM
jgi:LmbE family N-acetylglucosaminyl deacetylase